MNPANLEREAPMDLAGRSWEDLDIVEGSDGHLLVREQILERSTVGGEIRAVPIRLRLPRTLDLVRGRADARKWFAEFEDLDQERDADVFGELEQMAILSESVRAPDSPYGQLCTRDELTDGFDAPSLECLVSRLTHYRALLDPRTSEQTDADRWYIVDRIAKTQHLGSLTALTAIEQTATIHFMARSLMASEPGRAWSKKHDAELASKVAAETAPERPGTGE